MTVILPKSIMRNFPTGRSSLMRMKMKRYSLKSQFHLRSNIWLGNSDWKRYKDSKFYFFRRVILSQKKAFVDHQVMQR
jgi:hypothetical protein